MSRGPKRIPSMVKNPQLVEKRRRQIIRGACDLFIRKGFHKTTTREIARECGLSIGTMYEYIQSKEDVLYLVCDYIHSELEARLKKALDQEGTGRERLTRAIAQHFKAMDAMRDDVLLIYQETKSLPKDAMSYVLKKEEEITSLFEAVLQRGIQDGTLNLDQSSVKLMAHNIMVLGEMWTFRGWVLRQHYTLEEYTRLQTALLLDECTHQSRR
ncbi:MAG: TetR/AcrR family transcriptional regulator [Firmicutes bacterium]|uniref:Transcriptional regulator, TetR family n=1 Tax=Melghirimyces thermohalophilus TaxID=1236220 RepID=A0A1G6MAK7_9BACL|nr:TetR/AcrR family transcriptional regulator [Melghirimyces thermohalophilus]MDA8354623.1 TetR/AcrR family transcriptional regulator [Bacillota bacterium]SDC51965.1 transcriptional regulator, TetR family [Melghirimyces thermohalophilus]